MILSALTTLFPHQNPIKPEGLGTSLHSSTPTSPKFSYTDSFKFCYMKAIHNCSKFGSYRKKNTNRRRKLQLLYSTIQR